MIKLCLNFLFTFIFFFQNSSWAYGVTSPETKRVMEDFVLEYNSLSHEAKVSRFLEILKLRPLQDQEFVRKYWGDFKKFKFPRIDLVENGFKIKVEGKEYVLIPLTGMSMKVNGFVVNMGPGEFEEAAEVMSKVLFTEKTSILDYIFPSAYALGVLLGVAVAAVGAILWISSFFAETLVFTGLMAGGATAFGLGLLGAAAYSGTTSYIRGMCEKAKAEVENLKSSNNLEEIKTVRTSVEKSHANLLASGSCEGLIHENDSTRKAVCDATKNCLKELKTTLFFKSFVNETPRDLRKDRPNIYFKEVNKRPSNKGVTGQ